MGQNISEAIKTPEGIPKDLFKINPINLKNYKHEIEKQISMSQMNIQNNEVNQKMLDYMHQNTNIFHNAFLSLLSGIPLVGIAVGAVVSIIIWVLKLLTEEVSLSVQEICKKEIAIEISSFLLLDLQSSLKTALGLLNENNYEQAKLVCLMSIDKLETFLFSKKFIQWSSVSEPKKGLKLLWYFYKICIFLCQIFLMLDNSTNKEEHKEKINNLIRQFRKQILDMRFSLMQFTYNYSSYYCQTQTHKKYVRAYTNFHNLEFNDKFYPEKQYSQKPSISDEKFIQIKDYVSNYRAKTLEIWDSQLDKY